MGTSPSPSQALFGALRSVHERLVRPLLLTVGQSHGARRTRPFRLGSRHSGREWCGTGAMCGSTTAFAFVMLRMRARLSRQCNRVWTTRSFLSCVVRLPIASTPSELTGATDCGRNLRRDGSSTPFVGQLPMCQPLAGHAVVDNLCPCPGGLTTGGHAADREAEEVVPELDHHTVAALDRDLVSRVHLAARVPCHGAEPAPRRPEAHRRLGPRNPVLAKDPYQRRADGTDRLNLVIRSYPEIGAGPNPPIFSEARPHWRACSSAHRSGQPTTAGGHRTHLARPPGLPLVLSAEDRRESIAEDAVVPGEYVRRCIRNIISQLGVAIFPDQRVPFYLPPTFTEEGVTNTTLQCRTTPEAGPSHMFRTAAFRI